MKHRLLQIILFPVFGLLCIITVVVQLFIYNSIRWIITGKGAFSDEPWFSDTKLSNLYQ